MNHHQPRHRRAYGRRRCSATLVEDLRAIAVPEYAAPPWVPRRATCEGRGDARALMQCPGCKRWAMTLYDLDALAVSVWGKGLRCRVCLRLRYRSQYQGRRPEAHVEACDALARSIQRATTPAAYQRRHTRLQVAEAIISERIALRAARYAAAYATALTRLLARLRRAEGIDATDRDREWADSDNPGASSAAHTNTRQSPPMRSDDSPSQSAWRQARERSVPGAPHPDFDIRR